MSEQAKYQLTLQTSKIALTVKEFLKLKYFLSEKDFDKVAQEEGFTEESIINLKIKKGVQPAVDNAFNIIQNLTDKQRKDLIFTSGETIITLTGAVRLEYEFDSSTDFANLKINFGTQIALPQKFLDAIQPLFFDSPVVFPFKKFKAFIGDEINKIIEDEGYEAKFKSVKSPKAGILKKHEKISVQIYSKALGGAMIELTPFVMSCTTSVTKTGGNFDIVLPPITAEMLPPRRTARPPLKVVPPLPPLVQEIREWRIKKNSLVTFGQGEYAFKDNMYLADGDEPKQNNYYFMNVIQPQDIVLIKFEALQMEEKGRLKRSDLGESDDATLGSAVNGQVLDMIGLVDNVSMSQNAGSADVSINVGGRDLVKMIIDDGTIFFAGGADETSEGVEKYRSMFFLNSEVAKKSPSFKRLFTVRRVEGKIYDVSLYLFQSIDFWLNYILTKLSTAKITFESDIPNLKKTNDDTEPPKDSDEERLGLWRLVRIVVDSQIQNRQLADSSIASDSGSLLNFINKFCQEPFIEFWTDTYGDRFYWIARKPPWTKEAFIGVGGEGGNHTEDIDDVDLLSLSLAFDDTQTYSWYRITPQVFYEGDSENANFYHPMVFFPEFAELYGARAMDIKSTYINYKATGGINSAGYLQGVEDLRWLIKSHAHLVFTRKGSITINRNRKIKRGMNVYLKSSDELFYVDAVSHTYQTNASSVDGVTTIQVSRGIVREHADRYFDLVDTSTELKDENEVLESTDLKIAEKGKEVELKIDAGEARKQYNWHVRGENFDFLMRREQFD